MNLVIDIGNTKTKLAVIDAGEIICLEAFSCLSMEDISTIINNYPNIGKVIYSCVGFESEELKLIKAELKKGYYFIEMGADVLIPIYNRYETPHTLGKDRLAGIIAAYNLFPKHSCLVIDAGTCITIDIIDNRGNYLGGSISPGLNMKYKALHNFTGSLPLIENKLGKEDIIGKTTFASICSGVINGTLMEIGGFIDYYMREFKDIKIIFTGGDAKLLQNYFKEHSILEEHLVLQGLNIILETNVKEKN